MADEQIDSLSIGISVQDNGSAETIKGIANAIASLVLSLKGLDSMQGVLKTLESAMSGISKAGGMISSGIKATQIGNEPQLSEYSADISVGNLPSISKAFENFNEQVQENIKIITEDEYAIERLQIAVGQLDGTYNLSGESAKDAAKAFGYNADEANKAGKKVDGAKAKFSEFFSSIKRIAFYRIIRTALKEITQAMQEGIQNYSKYDAATNQAMSNLMNAKNQLVNTLGVTLGQVMQTFGPLLEQLAGMATELFNNINMALASLQGKSTYSKAIKQNEDYAKSLDKVNGKLLSFDTFNTLATSNDTSKGLFEEAEMPSQFNETADLLKIIFELGQELFAQLKEWWSLLQDIIVALKPVIQSVITFIKGILQQFTAAFQMIRGLIKLLSGDFQGAWEAIGSGFKNMLRGMINMFIGVINVIIDVLNFLITKLNPIGWIFGAAGIDISIPHIPEVQSFATGGGFSSADMFYANENGRTELIASSNSGGAVMNMEQLRESIYDGMVMAMADSGGKEIVLKVDQNTLGRVVANSTGFINETNRIKLIKL